MARIAGTRNKHPRRIWTTHEDQIIHKCYYRFGAEKTATILTRNSAPRSAAAVATRARRILQRTGIPDTHVPLVDVHPYDNQGTPVAHWKIVNAARRDGVLATVRTMHSWTHTAPTTWCDRYLEQLAEAERYADWIPTREVANLFRVPIEHVRAGLRDSLKLKIKPYLEGIPRVVPYPARQGYVWEPESARREAMDYLERAA